MSADEEPQSLKALFADAESKRESLDEFPDSNTETFQENLRSAIAAYEGCLKVVDRISLFSSNETLEDVSSNDLQ
jgi:immunoglobulin-binding protein 1